MNSKNKNGRPLKYKYERKPLLISKEAIARLQNILTDKYGHIVDIPDYIRMLIDKEIERLSNGQE